MSKIRAIFQRFVQSDGTLKNSVTYKFILFYRKEEIARWYNKKYNMELTQDSIDLGELKELKGKFI